MISGGSCDIEEPNFSNDAGNSVLTGIDYIYKYINIVSLKCNNFSHIFFFCIFYQIDIALSIQNVFKKHKTSYWSQTFEHNIYI